jgi:sigma-B regulation protein RsbU (phosphoserine phosphatase)
MSGAKPSRHTIALYAALAALFAIGLTHRLRDTADRFEEVVRGHELAQLPFEPDFAHMAVDGLTPEAEAAGLRRGDVITAIQGRPVGSLDALIAPVMAAAPGEILTLDVESDADAGGNRRTVSIALAPIRSGPPQAYDWLQFAIGAVALPYLCLTLGFWVAATRITDKLAWLVLLLLLGLSEFVGVGWRTMLGRDDWFRPIALVYQPLLDNLWPMSMMLFGIYFPDRLALDRRFPWAKWIVVAPILFTVGATMVVVGLVIERNFGAAAAVADILRPVIPVALVLDFVAIAIFFGASGHRAFTEKRPDARRRLMLLHASGAVSLTPICLLAVLLAAGVTALEPWMLLPIYALLFVFPATMAYVIVVHRAMDVRLVVRQGVQYLLARGTVRGIQMAISAAIIVAVATQRGPFLAPQPGRQILLVGGALIAILQIRRVAEIVKRWVDRRFFREAYDAEQILAELANKVRTMVETGPLLETVAHQVASSLHIARVAILLNGGDTLEPAYAIGYATVPRLPLSGHRLTEERTREIRGALDAEMVLPLSANQKLIGVMGLGPKQSEEPFSSADIRLLDAVAAQMGLALENSRLTVEIAAEIANRESAKRELAIAREVQERLFPQELPPIPGIEYDGACRPALGVGGDYYDFIPLGGNGLGIAIGDVSGKGIPAALLMATLRAYLRGQTISGESDLAAVIANLNHLVYESSAANRYATFFYGQYDAATHVLRYVNAGHNPPMLFKQSGAVVRLDVGGPVVGLIAGCAYRQGCVTLDAGDLLIAFTDGISEAMNGDMDEWGEERLIAAVLTDPTRAPRPLIDHIMREADGFVSEAPQHDDMTVAIVRRVY